MKGIRDWVFSQVLSNSLAASRPLSSSGSFFRQGPSDEDSDQVAPAHTSSLVAPPVPPDASYSSDVNQDYQSHPTLQQVSVEDYSRSQDHNTDEKKMDPLAKIEDLKIKFLRLLQRIGHSQSNLLVTKVLYRLHLATLIQAGESDLTVDKLRSDRARRIAREQEAAGLPELDFSIRILVLGKTGVGKSATINSIFHETKTETDAFQPATDCIREFAGTVNGIKISFIDTPGLLPSSTRNMRRNRKILLSVKKFIRKSPPDIVLYFERLDLINMGYSDFPLLKLMTEVFGTAIWFNTILVMTHSSSTVPEGPSGYRASYESYVTQCSDLVQQYIHQAVSDSRLENPVLQVENHPQCRKNFNGEHILPNGQVWKSHFLLLCVCTKVLGDANALLDFRDGMKLGPLSNTRLPSLPHLLSSFLRHRSLSTPREAENEMDEVLASDLDEEDEYDQLPTIRILTKSQFDRLTKSQKNSYLDELDYREILYYKKQLKEESRKRKENKLSSEENFPDDSNSDVQASPDAVPLPDITLPPSFDSDCPSHRYRCLDTSDQWVARPVLDPQGWDHDISFDGVNLETALEIKRNVFASVTGQMSKDKQDFSIHSECAAVYTDPRGPMYCTGLDVQSSGKDMIYTVHSNTKLRNFKHNVTECGVSLTSFRNNYYVGAKLEDTLLVGKRLKLVMNGGRMGGGGQVAYGGSVEATLRGRDYPMRNENVSLSMTALSYNKEMVLSGGIQSEFQPSRGMKVMVNANLNNRKVGQICVKLSSSEHIEIALIAVFSILGGLLRKKATKNRSSEALESG
ncbi:hypothetical protein LWI28_022180 [Acer negundo]|uniref:AIG1-type G domain-containing protein n=1 Tax=Acer negundo TaxID=4023 RepID=A0AAD5NZN8_ACENE|nr:hypothetical protein LWI28_022180 [Acer negundo]